MIKKDDKLREIPSRNSPYSGWGPAIDLGNTDYLLIKKGKNELKLEPDKENFINLRIHFSLDYIRFSFIFKRFKLKKNEERKIKVSLLS